MMDIHPSNIMNITEAVYDIESANMAFRNILNNYVIDTCDNCERIDDEKESTERLINKCNTDDCPLYFISPRNLSDDAKAKMLEFHP